MLYVIRGEVLSSPAVVAPTPGEGAETKVAMGDEGSHAAGLGELECLTVVSLAVLGVESIGMGRNVAMQVQRMCREARMARREFDRAVAQAARIVGSAEQQGRPTEHVVEPREMSYDFRRRETLDDLLGKPDLASASTASPSCARA
jgi:hypothetical protein